MNTYNLKVKNEQKWLQSDMLYFDQESYLIIEKEAEKIFKSKESKRASSDPKNAELRQMLNDFEVAIAQIKSLWAEMGDLSKTLSSIYSHDNTYLMFQFPKLKTCTRLNDAYVGTTDINVVVSNVKRVLACHKEIKDKLEPFLPLYSCVKPNSPWDKRSVNEKIQDFLNENNTKVLKEIAKLEAQLSSGAIEIESKNAENSFLNKTSWAIFSHPRGDDSHNKGGYIDKHKSEGDISTARLFDSDAGALRTAKALRFEANTYDIVEVEINFKKRTHLVPNFQSNTISELEAILEKEKIDEMFASLSVEKIEARLSEIKQKNKNKL